MFEMKVCNVWGTGKASLVVPLLVHSVKIKAHKRWLH